jgi:hypothetical protein
MILFSILSSLLMTSTDSLRTPFENGNGDQTCTYQECIDWYRMIDERFENVQLQEHGNTSVGRPMHLLVIDKDRNFDPSTVRGDKAILLINNGIHPGEPDGIDASMLLVRDLLTEERYGKLLDDVVVLVIPVMNVAGMLDRGSFSRANQYGPEEYGFRGNRQHLDLNRDFVKCDSPEALTFNRIFSAWRPQVFVDTHVSNGADYQYTVTYIPTQADKLHPVLAEYQRSVMMPEMEKRMIDAGWEMTPYVNTIGETPESGIVGFLETPRYSTGYAALHHSIGSMPETHMLKPYRDRVTSTYHYLLESLKIAARDHEILIRNQREAIDRTSKETTVPIRWKLVEDRKEDLLFKGYRSVKVRSEISGAEYIKYDRDRPFQDSVDFFNSYAPSITIEKPVAYLVPQCYPKVIELLEANGVRTDRLAQDTLIEAEVYRIKPGSGEVRVFEGHHPHGLTDVQRSIEKIQCYKGDIIVRTGQAADRYIVETLEPQAHDSFFTWNFFDGMLSQKEHYSRYVFEELAADLLKNDAALRKSFEKKKKDPAFAADPDAQLDFVYRNSPYYETAHLRYPVLRLLK